MKPGRGAAAPRLFQRKGRPMKNRNPSVHSSLLALVGGYMLYITWHLLREQGDTGMAPGIRTLFMILFAAAGIGTLVYAGWIWKKDQEKQKEEREEKGKEK